MCGPDAAAERDRQVERAAGLQFEDGNLKRLLKGRPGDSEDYLVWVGLCGRTGGQQEIFRMAEVWLAPESKTRQVDLPLAKADSTAFFTRKKAGTLYFSNISSVNFSLRCFCKDNIFIKLLW